MKSSFRRHWPAVIAFAALAFMAWPAGAQPDQSPTRQAIDSDRNSPSYIMSFEVHATVRPDLTSLTVSTVRFKILRESAIRALGQRALPYVESINRLEIVEAYTEKSGGQKIAIDPDHILTRDAATGLNAIYERDAKVKTLIFPDIEVGDTLVYVTKSDRFANLYPGHFSTRWVFAKSVSYGDVRLTIVEPKLPGLKIHLKGDGLSYETVDDGAERRHMVRYTPTAWTSDEPGAVASSDRDPQVVLTTFKDMKELGASYWSSMGGHDVVTPEIQALADEITRGIEDKRAQAKAIDQWIKKNIRYVHILLGTNGVTPHNAPVVLRNKFGDCKDHAALMSAVLKAKGIASEQALINSGNMYQLPELPVPGFNHVMLYLPDFDLYTDPTGSQTAFGVLPLGSYDKPVLHISEAGGRPARTPPMKPEDHVTTIKTTAFIDTNGAIKGTTRETATGIFATIARGTGMRLQAQGREKYAEAVLRSLGHPGSGVFEPAAPFDFSEPYTVQGDFKLNERLRIPLEGPRGIPFGMPTLRRPGDGLLGSRLPGRKTDFICYAGKQVEEIEVTFADGLPLPRALKGGTIETKYMRYQSDYRLQDRTLFIRREFTSKVASQICSKDIEPEISEPMQRIAGSQRTQMFFVPVAPGKGEGPAE